MKLQPSFTYSTTEYVCHVIHRGICDTKTNIQHWRWSKSQPSGSVLGLWSPGLWSTFDRICEMSRRWIVKSFYFHPSEWKVKSEASRLAWGRLLCICSFHKTEWSPVSAVITSLRSASNRSTLSAGRYFVSRARVHQFRGLLLTELTCSIFSLKRIFNTKTLKAPRVHFLSTC